MKDDSASTSVTGSLDHVAGKYLTFSLATEEYGLEIIKVREILGVMNITAVPRTPEHVKGVINLRGKVIPVIDLRRKFGMEEAERTKQTCVIVVEVGNVEMGIIVDQVSEVLDIAAENIEDTPAFGTDVDTRFILGMAKTNGKVTILLDIRKLLSQSDVAAVEQCAAPDNAASPARGDDEPAAEVEREETLPETAETALVDTAS